MPACLAALLVCGFGLSAQSNVSFRYFYDDLGQLTKVVDSTGIVIEYIYDPVGNILQIKRSTVASGTLAIFNFTPHSGGPGQTITIQGQAFDLAPANDVVQFNGAIAPVLSASATTLTVTVPAAATTGPISVTVAGQTATSTNNFTVLPAPVIAGMSCKSALFNKAIANLQVSGFNLSGATFAFFPVFSSPAINVTAASIDPSGSSAVLSLQVGTQAGTFALVATNSAGSSSAFASPANRFTVVDPRSGADSSGNGFPDFLKAASCLDPLDPKSIPAILPVPETESLTVSLVNGVAPPHASPSSMEADSSTVALLNGAAPFTVTNKSEADSLTVSLLNGIAPPHPSPTAMEAESFTVSLLNGIAPPQPVTKSKEADSLTVSLLNGVVPTQTSPVAAEAESLTVSLLNGVAPPASHPALHEADSLTTSLLNGIAPPVQPTVFEVDSLTVSVANSAPKTTNATPGGHVAYASLNQHPQLLHNGSNARKRSVRKAKTLQADAAK